MFMSRQILIESSFRSTSTPFQTAKIGAALLCAIANESKKSFCGQKKQHPLSQCDIVEVTERKKIIALFIAEYWDEFFRTGFPNKFEKLA